MSRAGFEPPPHVAKNGLNSDPLVSTSPVLGLQACTRTPGSMGCWGRAQDFAHTRQAL